MKISLTARSAVIDVTLEQNLIGTMKRKKIINIVPNYKTNRSSASLRCQNLKFVSYVKQKVQRW